MTEIGFNAAVSPRPSVTQTDDPPHQPTPVALVPQRTQKWTLKRGHFPEQLATWPPASENLSIHANRCLSTGHCTADTLLRPLCQPVHHHFKLVAEPLQVEDVIVRELTAVRAIHQDIEAHARIRDTPTHELHPSANRLRPRRCLRLHVSL